MEGAPNECVVSNGVEELLIETMVIEEIGVVLESGEGERLGRRHC